MKLSDATAAVLAPGLVSLSHLERFVYCGGFLGEQPAPPIPDEGNNLPVPEMIEDFNHDANDPDGFEGQKDKWGRRRAPVPYCRNADAANALGAAVAELPCVTFLDFRSAFDIRRRAAAGADALAQHAATMSGLRVLDFSRCAVGEAGAAALTDAMPAMGQLSTLDLDLWLRHCGAEPRSALLGALAGASQLEWLGLSGNGLGDAGAVALAPALGALTRLSVLLWHCNGLSVEGAAALAQRLAQLTQLKHLDLRANTGMGEEGAAALCSQLAGLTQLEHSDKDLEWQAEMLPLDQRGAGSTVSKVIGLEVEWVEDEEPAFG
jgi:Ran GTPase-activating protein (RanGAP) involved in mRNA processing and transport